LDNTSQGILERDRDEATVKELIIGKFKHYYTLELIKRDRSSFKPAAYSDSMFSEDYNNDSTVSDEDDKLSDNNIEVTDEHPPVQSATNAQEVQQVPATSTTALSTPKRQGVSLTQKNVSKGREKIPLLNQHLKIYFYPFKIHN